MASEKQISRNKSFQYHELVMWHFLQPILGRNYWELPKSEINKREGNFQKILSKVGKFDKNLKIVKILEKYEVS